MYTSQIMECLEAMIAGKRNIVFQESQETLMGKIQMRMRRLYEIIEMKSEENLRQREQLESMISGISHQVKTPIRRGKEPRFPLGAMAVANLSRNKGKTLLVVLSLSFSAVLLNCALNYTGNMDEETFVEGMVISDIDVRSRDFLKPGIEEYKKVVKGSAVRELENLEGVQDFEKVYTYMLPKEKMTEKREDLGKILRVNGKETSENSQVFERNRMLYGYNENALARAAVIEGTMDYEKLCSGDYVVMAGSLGDSGEYNYEAQEFHAGDIIEAEIKGTVKEYTVLAVVGVEQAQEMSYSSGGYEAIGFPESVFLQMFPEMQNPIHCLFDAKEGSFDTLYLVW